jgi:2-hydroxychromene-2-carboxylate isomerase
MSLNVEFIYDFGSPNSYLVDRALRGIETRTGVKFTYVPVLLGGVFKATGNLPPFLVHKDVKPKLRYELLEDQRFMEKHGIDKFVYNPNFPVNSLMLMRAAAAAEMDGTQDAFVQVALKTMWEDGKKMDDPEVFVQALTEGGLDGEKILASTQDADVKAHLVANTNAAVERGVFGVPTFFVGDQMFFGKERLDQVEQAIAAAS